MPFIAYFFVLVLTAVTAAVSLDYLTAPDIPAPKHEAAKAADGKHANAIRQVPIGRTTAPETTGQATAKAEDKNDKDLTPIYPAAPGKNLPDAQTADADNKTADTKTADAKPANASDKPQAPPALSANATPVAQPANGPTKVNPPATPVSTQASAPTPAGACAIQACASAYRSFRASDCTYQPYGGARKLCDLSADGARQASNTPAALPVSQGSLRGSTVGRADDFDDVVRTVRRLPAPQAGYDDEDDGYDGGADGRGRVVVIQRERARPVYGPRYIYEER